MIEVYRHDIHKTRGQSHASAPDVVNGVQVNQDVPHGADADAAAMSRPTINDKPEPAIPGHDTHYRRSLITGNTAYDPQEHSLQQYEQDINRLVSIDDAQDMHTSWIQDRTIASFNESVWRPYTSLKYHTLLVVALVANYEAGHDFDDLGLYVIRERDGGFWYPLELPSTHSILFRFDGSDLPRFRLAIAPIDRNERSSIAAKISRYPFQNFASVWSRLPVHPLPTDEDGQAMIIDAQLRRIRSWSTGLQYLEDVLIAKGGLCR